MTETSLSMSKKSGMVAALSVSDRKGVPKNNVNEVNLLVDWGIEGDAHAGNWRRQVSLLAAESIDKMLSRGVKALPGMFAENITTRGIDVASLQVGERISLGEAELVVTQIGKECHERCAIFHLAGDCVMPREGVFATVTKGGAIQVGDSINVIGHE